MLLINISVQLNLQYKAKFQINNNHFSLHLYYSTETIKFQTQVSVLDLLLQVGMIQIFSPCTISKELLVNIELINILELTWTLLIYNITVSTIFWVASQISVSTNLSIFLIQILVFSETLSLVMKFSIEKCC